MKIWYKIKNLNFKNIIAFGIFQILSLIPGVSRSGIVITACRIYKFNRIDAAKIAFGNFFKDLGSSLSEKFLQGWERFTGGIAFLGEKFREITGLPTIAEALELDEADQDCGKK